MAPVHDAVRRNDVEALRTLLDADPGQLEEEEQEGHHDTRPLVIACSLGFVKGAELLLDWGVRGTAIDERNTFTPVFVACSPGHPAILSLLLSRGVDPAWRDAQYQSTSLMMAAEEPDGRIAGDDDTTRDNYVRVIRMLLADGRVPVNESDSTGTTALWEACYWWYAERARVLLLEGGADHTIADRWDVTPMAAARASGSRSRDCVELLEWYECQFEKPFLLSKARAVVDATESIRKAPEKVGARTRSEAQQVREEAAPLYLRERVARREALPSVEVLALEDGRRRAGLREADNELHTCLKYMVRDMKEDLLRELMEGLRYPMEVRALTGK